MSSLPVVNLKLSRFSTQPWSSVLSGVWAMSFQQQFAPLMDRVGKRIYCDNGNKLFILAYCSHLLISVSIIIKTVITQLHKL